MIGYIWNLIGEEISNQEKLVSDCDSGVGNLVRGSVVLKVVGVNPVREKAIVKAMGTLDGCRGKGQPPKK